MYHRITEWQGLEGTSVGHPAQHPAQAGSPRAGCTAPRPGGLDYLQRRRLHNLPGQPGPGLHHPQREEVLPHVQLELPLLQFVPVAPCPDHLVDENAWIWWPIAAFLLLTKLHLCCCWVISLKVGDIRAATNKADKGQTAFLTVLWWSLISARERWRNFQM